MKELAKYIARAGFVLALSGCGYLTQDINEALNRRPIKYIQNLEFNGEDTYGGIIKKSELEGILDCRNLVNNASLEEQWVIFLDEEMWVETGIKSRDNFEDGKPISSGVDSDASYERLLYRGIVSPNLFLDNHSNLIHYHYHPTSLELKAKERGPNFSASSILPSYGDLHMMASQTIRFKNINPKGAITHKVCSSYGITEYSLTEKGFEFYREMNPNMLYHYFRSRATYTTFYSFDKKTKKLSDVDIGFPHIKINFISYEDLLT